VDTASAELTVDGSKLAKAGIVDGITALPDGFQLRLSGISEGPHKLQARVYDLGHSRVGVAELTFYAAARLRIDALRVVPNPAFGSARLLFSLTRPASFEVYLFDVTGRRVYALGPTSGTPAENEIRLGTNTNGARLPGGVYFYTVQASYQEQRSSAKGRVVFVR
jgi:hypothetical protein